EPRMSIHPPTACIEPEIVQHQLRLRECAVAVAQGHVDAVVAERDDVHAIQVAQVSEYPHVLVHPPAARFVTQVSQHEAGICERAIAVAERRPDAVVAKPYDVRSIGPRQVTEKPHVLVQTPATRRVPVDPLLHIVQTPRTYEDR